jgi:hypothetical protein
MYIFVRYKKPGSSSEGLVQQRISNIAFPHTGRKTYDNIDGTRTVMWYFYADLQVNFNQTLTKFIHFKQKHQSIRIL